MKYEIGDYVSKRMTGVCRVEDILHLDLAGVESDQLYYLLIPVDNQQEKIYVPVVTAEPNLRMCMTSEEAWKLIERIPEICEIWVDNEKLREQKYKEAIKTNIPEELVSVIKMIYQRKKMRLEQGKKILHLMKDIFRLQKIFCMLNWDWLSKSLNMRSAS
ncbi:MAG: CarD family transcriptional regulator [Lachnospiraceae bacterium]